MSNDGRSWTAIAAVIVVTLLTATSVAAFTGLRHAPAARHLPSSPGPVSSAPEASPTPLAPTLAPPRQVQLSVPSAKVVWALVDYQSLFVSTDGGNRWDKRSLPDNFGVRPSVSFINANEGWLLAPGSPATQCDVEPAAIWHTKDGGATWQDLGARIGSSQCKNGIWFVDSTHGFVTSWDQNHRPTIYRTSDGGDHWASSTLPDNPIFVTQGGGFTLHVNWIRSFWPTTYLQASGSQDDPSWRDRDFVYVSTNGGLSWTWKQKVASHELVLVTQQRWLEIDPPGRLDESTNGGQAMAPFQSNLNIDPSAAPGQILFGDASLGYVSRGGSLQRTVDGGAHWMPLSPPWASTALPSPSPSPAPIAMPTSVDLSAPSSNVLWALVGDLRLFFSADHGKSWQERSVPAAAPATEISFVDDNNGWLSTCANSTLLWRTTDGARSWHTVSSPFPPDQCVLGLSFMDGVRGFISEHFDYSPPAIFTTPDGGVTWNGAPIDDNPPGFQPGQAGNQFSVRRIAKIGNAYYLSASGFVAGVYGEYVYGSTDKGATWRYLLTTPTPLDSLVFVTATRWLAIGNDGKGDETTDAGKAWHAFTCNYTDAAGVASTFTFADASLGYGTVRGGIQVTIDGGLHWTRINTPGT